MTDFGVWAPERDRVRLWLAGGVHPMTRGEDGWWRVSVDGADHGADYGYLLDDAVPPADPADIDDDPDEPDAGPLPDPGSRWQPYGVHGPSRTYDHDRFGWTDQGWYGRALPGSVIYELHIGTFTGTGTLDAAVAKLDHLVELGVDLVELLPVNAFNGEHGWGYDGELWYATHQPYGGPDGLKRFVDACHARGLGVIMDVVYNHLGPAGGHIGEFAPYLLKSRNIWGPQVNLDGPDSDPVRRYILDNALMWLRDFHCDGLRLDAVQALHDSRAVHLLEELATETAALAAELDRPLSLIAESDLNDPRLITDRAAGGYGLHAQWNDDLHHALHAALTGERQGYYADFGPVSLLAKALCKGFVIDGGYSAFRRRSHGRPVDPRRVAGHRFVVYAQDHDQIGNRATGDRLSALLSPRLLKVAATLVFTSPYTPMLFMGEEWGAATPWQYFSDHPQPKLARAVRRGRRKEFAAHGWRGRVPDPQDPAAYRRSKLDWSEPGREPHRELLALHRRLIALRRAYPELTDPRLDAVDVSHGEDWRLMRRGSLVVAANLAAVAARIELPAGATRVVFRTDPAVGTSATALTLPPESAAVVGFAG